MTTPSRAASQRARHRPAVAPRRRRRAAVVHDVPAMPLVDFREDGLDRQYRDGKRRDHRRLVRAAVLVMDVAALLAPAAVLGPVSPAVWLYVALGLLALIQVGAYRPRITLSALEEAPHVVPPLAFAFLVVATVELNDGFDVDLALHALCSVPSFVAFRGVSYAVVRALRRRGALQYSTLILGGGELGMDLLTSIYEHPEYGMRAVGFLDGSSRIDDREPLGPLTDIERVLDEYGICTVIVAFGRTREAELVGLLRNAVLRDVEIYIVPRFFDLGLAPTGPDVDDLWGFPLYRVRRAALRSGAYRFKRVVDITVASLALVLLSPVLAVLAVAVRVSSPGPILFRQPRIGQDGKEIRMLKFRSLRVPRHGATAGRRDAGADLAGGTGGTEVAMARRESDVDDRKTAIGALLRRTSLDELPQLWNILRGDMSLVGPRPEERSYAERFDDEVPGYRDRHRLAVGLTGWAQVHGLRGDTSLTERARFDNHYIEHWSGWFDLVIVLRTAGAVVGQAVRPRSRNRRRRATP